MLQYIVLATAWNILGGYTGYINFGTGAFFAIGAYSSVVLHKLHAKPALIQDWFGIGDPGGPAAGHDPGRRHRRRGLSGSARAI